MPFAPFAPRPAPHPFSALRVRIAIAAALLGVVAALLAYAVLPSAGGHHRPIAPAHVHRVTGA